MVDASGEYVWETDAEWRYTYLSERAEAVLGYPRAELLGRKPQDFMPLGEPRAVDELVRRPRRRGAAVPRPRAPHDHQVGRRDLAVGERRAGARRRGALVGWRGTGADVTARKHAEARIEQLTTRDALTGLPNSHAARATARARRSSPRRATARSSPLLCIDLDRFKLVNESLGHRAGDALLRAVAERLGNLLHGDDTLARLGGDDFVLLQSIAQRAKTRAALAQRLLGVLARPFTVDGRDAERRRPRSASASTRATGATSSSC